MPIIALIIKCIKMEFFFFFFNALNISITRIT